MTDLMEKALAAVRKWPQVRQDEAAEILLALDLLGRESYDATNDELKAIDEAIAQSERSDFATEDEVEQAFARFRV